MDQQINAPKGSGAVAVTIVLFIASVLAFITPTYAQPPIPVSSCGTLITTPNAVAVLTTNLVNCASFGVRITASGVTLYLNRHVIDGVPPNGSGTYGIRSEGNHVRIKGPGVVTSFDEGVRIQSVSRNLVEGVTAANNPSAGIRINNASKNQAKYNVVYGSLEGIMVEGAGARGNVIEGNDVHSNPFGIRLSGVAGSYVHENTLSGNTFSVLVGDGSSNNEIEENNVTRSDSGITIGVNASTACAANNDNEVESNIVGNNGVGVEIVATPRTGCTPPSQTGNEISDNTFFFNNTAITDQGVGTVNSGNRIVP